MIPCVKAHACGNDFLILDEALARDAQGKPNHADLARHLCARNLSIGADGIEFLDRRPDDTFFLRLFNADGSEAELSGNGTRCVAAWLAYNEGLREVTLGTHGGPRACTVVECSSEAGEEHFRIRTGMGVPRVTEHTVHLSGIGPVTGAIVDVGNPHFVLFTGDPDFSTYGVDWQDLGARLCIHPDFPKQTNVEFVRVLNPTEIEFRIFERGVGPTTSSGTGTCASAAAAIALRSCARALTANSIGGPQQIDWPANERPMLLTGPANIICTGQVSIEPLQQGVKAAS